MAFTVQTTRRTPWVLGPSQVVDAMEVGVTTSGHNIYFEVLVPYNQWKLFGAAPNVGGAAALIDLWLDDGLVVGASFVQDVDLSGLLVDYMEFVVEVPGNPGTQSGPLTNTALVPMLMLTSGSAGPAEALIAAAKALLAANV